MSPSNVPSCILALELCASAPTIAFDVQRCVAPEPQLALTSPIDAFYSRQDEYFGVFSRAISALSEDDLKPIMELSLLGFVSSVEMYFRDLQARVIRICTATRERAQDESVRFGALEYYPRERLAAALTERTSFTDEKTLIGWLRKYWDIGVDQRPALRTTIEHFLAVSQLRHALVHSGGLMNSRNTANLGGRSQRVLVVSLTPATLDEIAGACRDLVRTVNNEVGRAVLWQWVRGGELELGWVHDRRKLVSYLDVFDSVRDRPEVSRRKRLSDVYQATKTARGQLLSSSPGTRPNAS